MPLPLTYISLDGNDGEVEREILGGKCNVSMLAATANDQSALTDEVLASADVAAVWHTVRVNEELLKRMPRVQAIVR